MEPKDKILSVMNGEGQPLSASEVVKLSGLEKSVVDKVFKELKKENAIVSPVRCKWEPAS